MSEIDDLRGHVAALERRVRVLEIREACQSTFHEYLYLMDVGYADEIVPAVFTADAVLEVVNFPPGSGQDLHLVGHDGITPLYDDHTRWAPSVRGGHHTSNVSITVADDLAHAELSAYMLTAGAGRASVQGGQYQGRFREDVDGTWRLERFWIISGWGWTVAEASATRITEPVGAERAQRGARPPSFRP
jgi:hypothetical protein